MKKGFLCGREGIWSSGLIQQIKKEGARGEGRNDSADAHASKTRTITSTATAKPGGDGDSNTWQLEASSWQVDGYISPQEDTGNVSGDYREEGMVKGTLRMALTGELICEYQASSESVSMQFKTIGWLYAKAKEFMGCTAKEISIMTMDTTYLVEEAYKSLYDIADFWEQGILDFVAYRTPRK